MTILSFRTLIALLLALLPAQAVYAVDSCQQIFAQENLATKPPSLLKISQDVFEEKVYAVHITKYFPNDGFIHAVTKDRGRFSATLHFTLGEPVQDHLLGNWSNHPYAIIMPVKNLRDQIVNLMPQDTFVVGDVKIPRDAYIFVPEGHKVPEHFPGTIVYYADGSVKYAIDKKLKDLQSIEFQTRNAGDTTKWRSADIGKTSNLKRVFKGLFSDKPYLTNILHSKSPWGEIDVTLIHRFHGWTWNQKQESISTRELKFQIYKIKNSLIQISETTAKMDLPEYALKSWNENLKELNSYLNILETELLLRSEKLSVLNLDIQDSKIVPVILSLRYDKKALSEYIISIKNELPTIASETDYAANPSSYVDDLRAYSSRAFEKELRQEFSGSEQKVLDRVESVLVKHSLIQLVDGRIDATEALKIFRRHSAKLELEDMKWDSAALLVLPYRVISAEFFSNKNRPSPLNNETLLFLRDPAVQEFLEGHHAFELFSETQKKLYMSELLKAKP